MTRALWLGVLVWLQFSILTINFRALAASRYVEAVLTDALLCGLTFSLFKLIQTSDANAPDVIGYMVGGMLGSVTGIWITRRWTTKS